MRIGIIQASSQRGKNPALYRCTCQALAHNGRGDTVVNYGVFPEEDAAFSYVETAVCISLLMCSGAADFIVTGCSSGQGMMLACNSLPGVLCGYAPTPQDAFLFGRINGGNALSLPLGLNYGWLGEINLQCTLDRLFDGPFGCGYPPEEVERKQRDTALLKGLGRITKKTLPETFRQYDPTLTQKSLQWTAVRQDILAHGTNPEILALLD
ncbi:MAG: RpiB/LacA/LacB family sugar-phosphate isomerase [Clostridiales bacterium]|nr:RpiB/LacA/LacB family sugar-phosphate isomerase [Clostridiales bacterium]